MNRLKNPACLLVLSLVCSVSMTAQTENFRFEQLPEETGLSSGSINDILQDHKGFLWFATWTGLVRYDGYAARIYKQDPGNNFALKSNKVTAIYEDRHDRLWIGTNYSGFYLYDREKEGFIRFSHDPKNRNSLSSDNVWSILEDSEGILWIGTEEGLNRFDPVRKTFICYENDPKDNRSLSHNFVYSLMEMPDHAIWVGTETGLNRLIKGKNGGDDFFIRYSLSPYGLSQEDYYSHNFIKSLKPAVHRPNAFWVGTSLGLKLVEYDNEDLNNLEVKTWYHNAADPTSLSNGFVHAVQPKSKDSLWVATINGLNLLDIPSGKFEHFTSESRIPFSLNNNGIRSLYQDRSGILWIGTEKGVNKLNLNAKPFKSLRLNESDKTDHVITCVINTPDKEGLWIGTRGGGLNFVPLGPEGLDRKGLRFYRLSPPRFSDQSDIVSDIMIDRNGWLWIATQGAGILKVKTSEIPRESGPLSKMTQYIKGGERHNLSDNYIMSLLECRSGDIWLGYWDSGLDRYDPVRDTLYHYGETAGFEVDLNAFPVVHLMETQENGRSFLWLGTRGDGVLKLQFDEKENKLRLIDKYRYDEKDPYRLSNNFINSFLPDRQGNIWIGTENGLNRLTPDGNPSLYFFENNGLANDAIQSILCADDKEVWVSTLKGISRIQLTGGQPKIKNFDAFDGLLDNFFDDNSALRTANGYFVFGGINGLNYFNPKAIKKDTVPPAIVISDFKLFNHSVPVGDWAGRKAILQKSISETDQITLSYRDNVIAFEFTGLQFSEPQKIRYAYKLEGFIEDWVYTDASQRIAQYTNLPYDDFVFKVKAANQDGVWSEPASIRLTIRPPFWLTTWAYAVYFLLFAAVLLGVRRITKLRAEFKHSLELERLEREKLEEVNRMKLQFFTNISHELRTPLTLILSPLEQLIRNPDEKPHLHRIFTRMHFNANRLLTMINQLLDIRKNEAGLMKLRVGKGDLVKFVKEIALSFREMAKQRNIRFHFTADHPELPLWFDPDQIEKVLFNLLSNAFKFTRDGGEVRIYVGLNDAGSHAQIRVKDNGAGIPEGDAEHIFDRFFQVENNAESSRKGGTGIGLSLAKSIVEKHKGAIEVTSKEGQGACFTVTLPLGEDHFTWDEKRRGQTNPPVEGKSESMNFLDPQEEAYSLPANPLQTAAPKDAPLILLVEDNPDIRAYLRENFESEYRILEAANGLEGLQIARAECPDLIIADIAMPKMDGIEMCAKVKSEMITSHIPVILLTARTSMVFKVDGLETGADDYITKPFNMHLLALRVRNLIESRKKLREKFGRSFDLNPTAENLNTLDKEFLERIRAEVESHLEDEHFSVDQLAATLCMSRMHLYRKLKALSGQSPNKVIRSIRLKKAAQLLLSGQYNVSEVTYMVGYNDLKSFREQFKKEFGVSPSDYNGD